MSVRVEPAVILIADDDADDRMMIARALEKSSIANPVKMVRDGEELMDYLCRRGDYANPAEAPRPALILLDLNMPRKSGREALREIKTNPALMAIPVVILTTSGMKEDISHTYDLGANAFVTKPVSFRGLVKALSAMRDFWFRIVRLP